MARDATDLDAFVAWVGETSPETDPARFPSREAKLAYYVNAYNALAMHHAVYSGLRPEQKVRFFFLSKVRMGGRELSLYGLENRIIRPLGEPRIHFALNCMVRGCPRLPREPFRAAVLEEQLAREARLFLQEDRNVQVLSWQRMVRLSSILKWYEGDFLAQAPSLVAYANRYRESAIPAEFAVQFLPYDWTLNEQ